MTASRVYAHLATEASLRGIDPERFKRAEAELRREEMRRVLHLVGRGVRAERDKAIWALPEGEKAHGL